MDKSRPGDKLAKKVREAHLEHFNFSFVIGEQEEEQEVVSLRDLQLQKDMVIWYTIRFYWLFYKGKMSIVELLGFLKSKDMPVSKEEIELKKMAFFSKEVREKNNKRFWVFYKKICRFKNFWNLMKSWSTKCYLMMKELNQERKTGRFMVNWKDAKLAKKKFLIYLGGSNSWKSLHEKLRENEF